jgi:hypothetical protein
VLVGRNDPCPCGSGKKFKSCHAGNSIELRKLLVDKLSSALLAARNACSDTISASVEHKAAGFKSVAAEIALHMVAQGGEVDVARIASRHVAAWLRDDADATRTLGRIVVDLTGECPRAVVLDRDDVEVASFDLSEEPPRDRLAAHRRLDPTERHLDEKLSAMPRVRAPKTLSRSLLTEERARAAVLPSVALIALRDKYSAAPRPDMEKKIAEYFRRQFDGEAPEVRARAAAVATREWAGAVLDAVTDFDQEVMVSILEAAIRSIDPSKQLLAKITAGVADWLR